LSNRIAIIDGRPTLAMNGKPRNGHAHNGHAPTPYQERRAEQAKAELTYDAARTGTDLDGHWAHADSLDSDSANSPTVRRNLRNRSRYETGSNGCYAGSLKTHADLFIGNETGPSLRMLTSNRNFNQAIEKAWFDWTQQIQLHRKLRCMFHARVQDGEVFGLLINNPALPDVQLDLLLIEADQVQSTLSLSDPAQVDGVHLDENNNVVAYDILPEHPGSSVSFLRNDAVEVPASQVIHWFKLERPSAHRGKPDMTSTLNVGAMNRRMREATVTSVEAAASVAALIHSQLSPAGSDEPDEVAPFKSFQIPRRSGLTLPMGWEADQMAALHPNAQYSEFHRQQLSELTSPIGQPYNVAAHDSSTYSFASGKLDTLAYRAALNIERQRLQPPGS
jgi:capsid protein